MTKEELPSLDFTEVQGLQGIKEAEVDLGRHQAEGCRGPYLGQCPEAPGGHQVR